MKNTHIQQIGKVTSGGSNWRTLTFISPLTILWADKEKIVLKVIGLLGRRQIFPREAIVRLSRWRIYYLVGLRIEHTQSRYAQFIVFWTFNYRRLKRVLQELEYPIVENTRNIKN